jgi:hypothetical protein
MIIKEIEYRTFDQLLDSVKLDFSTYDIENMIESQTLIKIAQKINKQLGLKIHPSKGKVVEVRNGKAKLPSDLLVLNFVLLCGDYKMIDLISFPYSYKTYADGVLDGERQAQSEFDARGVKQYTEILEILPGNNTINHYLNTSNIVIQAYSPSGNLLTFDVSVVNRNTVNIISESPETLAKIKVVILGSSSSYGVYCPPPTNPLCPVEPEIVSVTVPTCATLDCDPSGCSTVAYKEGSKLKKYQILTQLKIEAPKTSTFDEVNTNSQRTGVVTVKNGFLLTNFDEGHVFLNYEGHMEDEEGNLIVLDDPIANEYYEYALKQRILENLLANGEQVQQLYNLMTIQMQKAKIDAVNFVRTPGFKEMYKTWRMNRKAMSIKYIDMFKS